MTSETGAGETGVGTLAISHPLEVKETAGPPFTPREAGAAIAIGVISLLISGLLSVVLGTLADEHRLTAQGIGLSAMLEALLTGLVTGGAGIILKPRNLRTLGTLGCLALAAANLATLGASGGGVFLVRGLAALPEGLLLWIAIGMISRTATPERWAGVLLTSLVAVQWVLAAAFAAFIIPRFHANGAFTALAVVSLAGVGAALFLPRAYPPLVTDGVETSGPPPLRGWIALGATFLIVAASAGVGLYLLPLAHAAGLESGVARTGLSFALAAQIASGAAATALAGRARYIWVFSVSAALFMAIWFGFSLHQPAWTFIALTTLNGVVAMFIGPFIVPMTIEADPSRRAALQSGAVQLLGGAGGPLLAAIVIGQRVHGVLILGAVLILTALAAIAWLHMSHKTTAGVKP